MFLKKIVLREPIMSPDFFIPDGATVSVAIENGNYYLQASLLFFRIAVKGGSLVSVHRNLKIEIPDCDLLNKQGFDYISKKELLEMVVSESVTGMKYKEITINKCVDMVGYIKNVPTELFKFIKRSDREIVLSLYESEEPLIELMIER